MGQVDENLETFADDVMAFFALDAGYQAHAARIVLVVWMVETLGIREMMTLIRYLHGYLLMNKIGLLFSVVRNGKDTISAAFSKGNSPG
jgi:hypothetical protein